MTGSITQLEPFLTKREIAEHFRVSIRTWERKTRGLEPTDVFGRPRYKLSEVESWLQEHGQLRRGKR